MTMHIDQEMERVELLAGDAREYGAWQHSVIMKDGCERARS
jgi:hypothetical protein